VGYRNPSPPEPTTIAYGRFPAAKSELFFLAIISVVGLALLVGATHRKVFRCERAGGAVHCEEQSSMLWRVTLRRSFEGERLSSVEWRPYTGDKNREKGRTDLFDATGNPTAVLRGPRDEALEDYEALRRFLDDPQQESLELVEQRGIWIGLIGGLLCLLWASFIARSYWRTSGRFEVLVDGAQDRIVLRAQRFGLFRSKREHPLSGLGGVTVERDYIKRTKDTRGMMGEPAGQVHLEYLDGPQRALTVSRLPGTEVHEDLAERLREATGLAPQSRPVKVGEPDPVATKAAPKPPRRWSVYLTLGVPLLAVALGFGIQALVDSSGGRVSFQVERRCKFQGAELLPGAEMAMTLAPGEYVVEIFDPDVPGMWRSDTFEVREGEAQTYVCR